MAITATAGTHIVFWNIRAGGGPSRAQAIALELLERKPDIVCLCECRPTFAGQLAATLRDAGLTHTHNTADMPRTNALLIASRIPFSLAATAQPRMISITTDQLTLTAAHIPDISRPTARLEAWRALHTFARQTRSDRHLILGDLNADREAAPARDGVPLGRLASLGYADLIARHAGDAPPPTWVGPRGEATRIDHAFASESLVSQVESAAVLTRPRDVGLSDHAPLSVRLIPKGP